MKKLVIKVTTKIIIAICICFIISLVVAGFAPHLSNDLAIGQFENDDMSWTLMQSWYQIQQYAGIAYGAVGLIAFIGIGKDFYIYFKNRKENF